MTESPRRLVLRVSLKLFTLTALLFIVLMLLKVGNGDERTGVKFEPLKVSLDTVALGQPQRLDWAGGPLQLLRLRSDTPPYLFFDRGGPLNCPLRWYPPNAPQAPQRPWPGGFRDQCSGTWYLYDGQPLAGEANTDNLQAPPYRLEKGNLLLIGVSGDNAPLAN